MGKPGIAKSRLSEPGPSCAPSETSPTSVLGARPPSFAGVVRGHVEAREIQRENSDFRYLVGVRLVFSLDEGSPKIAAYPTDLAAYGRLCLLLTTGNRRAEKGDCKLPIADLPKDTEGILFIVLADPGNEGHLDVVRQLRGRAKGRVWIAANLHTEGVTAPG